MIVLDTSALVEFLVGSDDVAERLRTAMAERRRPPRIRLDLECASTLRGLVRGRKLPADEAARALDVVARMSLKRYGHVPLLSRIWELRENAWPYDAACVALAESLDAELVTVDRKLERIPDSDVAFATCATLASQRVTRSAGGAGRAGGMVGRLGLEPRTNGLKVHCSTIELTPRANKAH